jgi:hypothetical protein
VRLIDLSDFPVAVIPVELSELPAGVRPMELSDLRAAVTPLEVEWCFRDPLLLSEE